MTGKKLFGYVMTFVVLVGFPLLAFYFVNKGVRYRKALKKSLNDYGEVSAFAKSFPGKKISTEDKVVALFFLNDSNAKEVFAKMHKQFDNREDVIFLVNGDIVIEDSLQVWRFPIERKADFAQALSNEQPSFSNEGFLVSKQGHLVRKYSLSNKDDAQLFVKHIAYFLPPKKTPKAELIREKEK